MLRSARAMENCGWVCVCVSSVPVASMSDYNTIKYAHGMLISKVSVQKMHTDCI